MKKAEQTPKKKRLNAEEQIKAADGFCPKCRGGGTIRKNAYHAIICPICKGTGLSGKPEKRQKFNRGTKEKRTYNGVIYDSILEMRFAKWLDMLVRCDNVLSWERQVAFDLKAYSTHETIDCEDGYFSGVEKTYGIPITLKSENGRTYQYILDFKVTFADGHIEYWEVKSWWAGKKSKITGKRGKGGAHIEKDAKLKIAICETNNNIKIKIVTERDLSKGF